MPWIIFILLAGVCFCFGQFKIINSSDLLLMQVDSNGDAAIVGKATTNALKIDGSSPFTGMLLYSGDNSGNLIWTATPSDNQILKVNDPGLFTTSLLATVVYLNTNDQIQIQASQRNLAENAVSNTDDGISYYP
jgi:hypothetical protein